jgi:hypothetical protein
MSQPIILFLKSKKCGTCIKVAKNWENIVSAMKKVNNNLRIETIVFDNNDGDFDYNIYPRSLSFFTAWFPQIILLPGIVWDNAMNNLGPNNKIDIRKGAQVFNGSWVKNELVWDGYNTDIKKIYNIDDPSSIANWVEKSLENKDFLSASKKDTPTIVKVEQQNNAVPMKKPEHNDKDNNNNNNNNTKSHDNTNLNDNKRKNTINKNIASHDICAMKIVSRR